MTKWAQTKKDKEEPLKMYHTEKNYRKRKKVPKKYFLHHRKLLLTLSLTISYLLPMCPNSKNKTLNKKRKNRKQKINYGT